MNIVVWREKAAILNGFTTEPILSIVVDQSCKPTKVLFYLVITHEGKLPYCFKRMEDADKFLNECLVHRLIEQSTAHNVEGEPGRTND